MILGKSKEKWIKEADVRAYNETFGTNELQRIQEKQNHK